MCESCFVCSTPRTHSKSLGINAEVCGSGGLQQWRLLWLLILAGTTLHRNGEHSGGGQRPPTSPPLPLRSREDLRLDGYLEYPYATKALYIYKHSCLLWDSNPVPTAQQSASLTTIPDGWREEY
ncbi:UNVERIFIED_CONTAM: hypothetical protein NCL1_47415 [Trichonephila clavipes]